ncbi:unnamed protein product, partial [Amoebophrya sp. A25]
RRSPSTIIGPVVSCYAWRFLISVFLSRSWLSAPPLGLTGFVPSFVCFFWDYPPD